MHGVFNMKNKGTREKTTIKQPIFKLNLCTFYFITHLKYKIDTMTRNN